MQASSQTFGRPGIFPAGASLTVISLTVGIAGRSKGQLRTPVVLAIVATCGDLLMADQTSRRLRPVPPGHEWPHREQLMLRVRPGAPGSRPRHGALHGEGPSVERDSS